MKTQEFVEFVNTTLEKAFAESDRLSKSPPIPHFIDTAFPESSDRLTRVSPPPHLPSLHAASWPWSVLPTWSNFIDWLHSLPLVGWLMNPYAIPILMAMVLAVLSLRAWLWYWKTTVPAKWLTPRELTQKLKVLEKDYELETFLEENVCFAQIKEIRQAADRILSRYPEVDKVRVAKDKIDCADTTHS